jgi:hypothetical protein
LIEMVLVIGAATIVMGLCASVLSGLFRIQRSGQAGVVDATALARLARQFRQDVRAADAAKPGAGTLELTGQGAASVVYRVEGRRLLREARRGGEVRAREAYAADRLGPVAFGADGARVWAVLGRRPGEPRALARPPVRVEARLGKDRGLGQLAGAGT